MTFCSIIRRIPRFFYSISARWAINKQIENRSLSMPNMIKTSPTAELMAYFRGHSDIPWARDIADASGSEHVARNMLKDRFSEAGFLAVVAEGRFKKCNAYARKFKSVVEIAAGLSPRGLILTEDPHLTYVSTDLPEMLGKARVITDRLLEQRQLKRPNLKWIGFDALTSDESAVNQVLESLPITPLAVISEGFMMYLDIEEKKAFLRNIHRMLKERGGALITTDVLHFDRERKNRNHVLQAIADATGRDMRTLNNMTRREASEFFMQAGFYSEILNPAIKISSLSSLRLTSDPLSLEVASLPVWVLTPCVPTSPNVRVN